MGEWPLEGLRVELKCLKDTIDFRILEPVSLAIFFEGVEREEGRTRLNSKASFSRASRSARGSSPSSSVKGPGDGTEDDPVTGSVDEAMIESLVI